MVRMARFGLAMALTLALKVLTNFRLCLVTLCYQINKFQQKVYLLEMEEKEEKDAK